VRGGRPGRPRPAEPADKQRALAAGFDEHLTKPAEQAELERVLGVMREPGGT
jgi:CheY-like chemotaxis protein